MKLPETYLIEVFRPEAKHILELLLLTKDAKEDKEHQNYYRNLADWGSKHLQKVGEVALDKIELSYKEEVIKLGLTKRTKDLWGMINALIELMKKYRLNEENAKVIQQTTLEILAGLSKITPPKNENEDEEDFNLYEGMDWTAEKARRLEAGEGNPSDILNKFYDDYYSVEYAGKTKSSEGDLNIVARLKSLDKILIPEFNALGYNPDANPLAQFLKILIKLRAENNIFDKLNTNNYGAIHNSFINKKITGNMLGNYNGSNILFCNDLYNYKGLDIVEYIALWRQIYNNAEGNDIAKGILAAKLVINQPEVTGKTFAEKANNLKKPDIKVIAPTNKDAKLRSKLEIQELYRYIFRTNIQTEEDDYEELVKKEVNSKTIVDILNSASKPKNIMLDMIRLILASKTYIEAYPENTKKIKYWLEKREYKPSEENINKSKKILLKYTLTAQALNLIAKALINRVEEPTEN